MTPDNQKPDYSFIMNQPGPNPEKPPRSKKPFLIIGSLGVFLIVLTIIGLTVGKKSNNIVQVDSASQIVQNYVQAMSTKQYNVAYAMYSDTLQKQVKESTFVNLSGPNMSEFVKFNQCNISSLTSTDSQNDSVKAVCPAGNSVNANVTFSVSTTTPKKITKLVWSNTNAN